MSLDSAVHSWGVEDRANPGGSPLYPFHDAQHEFTRQDLFEMVWSKPITKLAAELMISDVAVKKICVKHEIPLPGLGYWAKMAAGHRRERPKLAAASKPELEEIRIHGSPRTELKPEIREAERRAKTTESAAVHKIVVPARIDHLHPVVLATLQKLRKENPNEFGVVVTFGPEFFRVSVSPGQLDRSIGILNAIARASEERGFPVEHATQSVCLRVNGEQIAFRLREGIDRKPHVKTVLEDRHSGLRRTYRDGKR